MVAVRALDADDFDDFDEEEDDDTPSYQFKLGEREWSCRQPGDVHWDTVERFIKAQATDNTLEIVTHMDEFFSAVLFRSQVEDFLKMKHDPAGGLSTTKMTKLIQRISERVLNRPTEQSSPSGDGLPKKARTSRAGSSSRGTRARTA